MNKLSWPQDLRLRCVMAVATLSLLLGGCVELRGTPDGLKSDDLIKLGRGDLATNLGVALDLSQRWSSDRNSNYDYSFWSNATLIPLAAGGAGAALYKGSRDLVTGIGLAAATVIGTNSFIDSSDTSAAYQAGIVGMSCIYLKLSPYTDSKKAQASATLDGSADSLESQIAKATASLALASGVENSAGGKAEVANNPSVVSNLANNRTVLTQTISNAQTTLTNARNETHLFDVLAGFVRDRIVQVDVLLSTRIKPRAVNYSTLFQSLSTPQTTSAQTTVGAAQDGSRKPAPAPAPAPAAPPPPPTPVADAANNLKDAITDLTAKMQPITKQIGTFDLSTQEANVISCLQSL